MDLFKRFPKFFPPTGEQDFIPPDKRDNYPAFAEDFAFLDRELMPSFRELDGQALRRQNAYRWMYVILIFGGSLTSILGIVQLMINDDWVAVTGAIVAALLGVGSLLLRSFHYQERFLDARLAAEALRCEYFRFLGHLAPYTVEPQREMMLMQRVAEIKMGEKSYAEA